MARQWTQQEWDSLPQAAKTAIWESHNREQAALKRNAQWDSWAGQNRQYLDRWGDVRQKLAEIEKADEEKKVGEMTYEDLGREIMQARREAQQAQQHVQGLAAELGQSRQHLQNLANNQRATVELSADMMKYSRETGRDPKAVLQYAAQNGIGDWPSAVSAYEAQEKAERPRTASQGSWARPGRERVVSREVAVNDAITDILNRGGEAENESPMVGSWTRASRKRANPVPSPGDPT